MNTPLFSIAAVLLLGGCGDRSACPPYQGDWQARLLKRTIADIQATSGRLPYVVPLRAGDLKPGCCHILTPNTTPSIRDSLDRLSAGSSTYLVTVAWQRPDLKGNDRRHYYTYYFDACENMGEKGGS